MTLTPCEWPVDVCEGCCDAALEGMPPERRTALEAMAGHFLWSATGKRYGLCERTYRPCRQDCGTYWGGRPSPYRVAGEWLNLSCGTCSGGCGCDTISEVTIADTDSVVGLRIDGVDVDPLDAVAVYDRRRIIRTDGEPWPGCQNLSSTDGPGTWSITVMQGVPLPPGAEFVAGILTCELAKACAGDDECRLPRRIQTLSRQGVTVGFQDNTLESLSLMRTGLWEVDSWIEAARTTVGITASVSSVDVTPPSVLTWPTLGATP